MRIEVAHPCTHPALAETRSVPFRERCARKQEAYFAIGGLTQEPTAGRSKLRTSATGCSSKHWTGAPGVCRRGLAEAEKRLEMVKQ